MKDTSWVYVQSEPGLYTVGFYDPKGARNADSDHESSEAAAQRVHYLNGGTYVPKLPRFAPNPTFKCKKKGCKFVGANKIDLIKHLRAERNLSLKDALDLADRMIR